MPFAGESCCGSTFNTLRSLVHTSNVQPTPQYVHTVFVFSMRSSRILASVSETANNGPYPVSTLFVTSIIDLSKPGRSEEHTTELQSRGHLVFRLLLEKH